MTDKQIIDGCDVSGCEWFYKNDPCKNTCKYFCTPCEWVEIQNCMYKYAKRKEQECERLEKQNDILLGQLVINDGEDVTVQISQSQFEEYNQLKAENDELKEEKQGLIKDWEEKKNLAYEIACKNEKLKQTLIEIKELLLKTPTDSQMHCVNAKSVILQKISEVENGV